jgi:flagellar protein FlaI
MHTGHSVYATLHANTVQECLVRITTEPIGISKSLLSALHLIIVQNRNRRTGKRRTFEIAEMLKNGEPNMLFSYNVKSDKLEDARPATRFYETIELFAGLSKKEVDAEIAEKMRILKYLTDNKITDTEKIALIISYYYINKKFCMKKLFGDKNK